MLSLRGSVASSQPLASQAGLDILKRGGNAADAAVAVAACLAVLEPHATGVGGDCFALFYEESSGEVKGLNGSGRSSRNVVLDEARPVLEKDPRHAMTVTVPGAAAGWISCVEEWGSGNLSLLEILTPAIELARDG